MKAIDNPKPSSAGISFLQEAFATDQNRLQAELLTSDRITHQGDKGEVNEEHFIEFLRKYLPNRYSIEKAIVLDSFGDTSDSIDIVVFDRQYTPTLLDSGKHRYVPAESVYAVFECKPTINKEYLEYAGAKAASVRALHRTSIPIPHAGGVFPAKEPGHIIAGILALDVKWVDGLGSSFSKNLQSLKNNHYLDCGFATSGACFDLFEQDHSCTFGPQKNSLAFFAFRLLSRLQAMATVPAVDWSAYASRLSTPASL